VSELDFTCFLLLLESVQIDESIRDKGIEEVEQAVPLNSRLKTINLFGINEPRCLKETL